MVYKSACQKILIYLFLLTFTITIISGQDYWKMWSILPMTFFILWLVSKNMQFKPCRRNVPRREGLQVRADIRELEGSKSARLLSIIIHSAINNGVLGFWGFGVCKAQSYRRYVG